MSEMSKVEEVARALCDDTMRRWRSPVFMKDEPWKEFIPAARAAIEAMRVPTPEMIEAGTEARWRSAVRDPDSIREIWNAGIDAALKE